MTDWLVVMSEDNWEICARECLLGLGRDAERRLGRMADGDRVWIYVNRKHVDHKVPHIYEIRAACRVAGPIRHLDRSPWKARGGQRFEFARSIAVGRSLAFAAKELLKSMSFAGRPPVWGMKLLNAPVRLTAEDVAKLEAAAGR